MINIEDLRKDPEKFKKGISDKGYDASVIDKVLELDKKRRELILEVDNLRVKKNKIAKEGKSSQDGKSIKEELKKKEPELEKLERKFKEALGLIPNLPSDKVPTGKSEKDNKVIRKWGEPKKFTFSPKDHLELGKDLGILDFETGAKVAGSQFYFWLGEGALLELALVQYAFETLQKEGFKPIITPDVAKERYYLGTGYSPKGREAQTYEIKNTDLGLIATAEVTLAGRHADEIISESMLPIKYIGYSHCFRQEAGAYGKYSKGLYRVHQFTKAEMFIYCKPDESDKYHNYILEMEEKIYQGLELPYRVTEMCTGDLGVVAARKFDIEVWMPGRNEYGEVTSTSNCTDYQARNLNIKYRSKGGENNFVHMLNGTAIATSRTPLAILEYFQNEDGSVSIPKVLQKWMGKEKINKT